MTASANVELVTKYVKLVEALGGNAETFKPFLHPDFKFTELPNQLSANGSVRDYATCVKGMELARRILSAQNFEILRTHEAGPVVVLEMLWTGTMAIATEDFRKGQELKAHLCVVFEVKDGKIHRQRNYDCYEPF